MPPRITGLFQNGHHATIASIIYTDAIILRFTTSMPAFLFPSPSHIPTLNSLAPFFTTRQLEAGLFHTLLTHYASSESVYEKEVAVLLTALVMMQGVRITEEDFRVVQRVVEELSEMGWISAVVKGEIGEAVRGYANDGTPWRFGDEDHDKGEAEGKFWGEEVGVSGARIAIPNPEEAATLDRKLKTLDLRHGLARSSTSSVNQRFQSTSTSVDAAKTCRAGKARTSSAKNKHVTKTRTKQGSTTASAHTPHLPQNPSVSLSSKKFAAAAPMITKLDAAEDLASLTPPLGDASKMSETASVFSRDSRTSRWSSTESLSSKNALSLSLIHASRSSLSSSVSDALAVGKKAAPALPVVTKTGSAIGIVSGLSPHNRAKNEPHATKRFGTSKKFSVGKIETSEALSSAPTQSLPTSSGSKTPGMTIAPSGDFELSKGPSSELATSSETLGLAKVRVSWPVPPNLLLDITNTLLQDPKTSRWLLEAFGASIQALGPAIITVPSSLPPTFPFKYLDERVLLQNSKSSRWSFQLFGTSSKPLGFGIGPGQQQSTSNFVADSLYTATRLSSVPDIGMASLPVSARSDDTSNLEVTEAPILSPSEASSEDPGVLGAISIDSGVRKGFSEVLATLHEIPQLPHSTSSDEETAGPASRTLEANDFGGDVRGFKQDFRAASTPLVSTPTAKHALFSPAFEDEGYVSNEVTPINTPTKMGLTTPPSSTASRSMTGSRKSAHSTVTQIKMRNIILAPSPRNMIDPSTPIKEGLVGLATSTVTPSMPKFQSSALKTPSPIDRSGPTKALASTSPRPFDSDHDSATTADTTKEDTLPGPQPQDLSISSVPLEAQIAHDIVTFVASSNGKQPKSTGDGNMNIELEKSPFIGTNLKTRPRETLAGLNAGWIGILIWLFLVVVFFRLMERD